MSAFNEGYTEKVSGWMDEFSERIYEIDDGLASIEENEDAIIEYLSSKQCTLSLGMAIRRYLCTKFGIKQKDGGYIFSLLDGSTMSVGDYLKEDYDIETDDVKEFTDVFFDIYQKYNPDVPIPKFSKAEARRLLRVDGSCQRKKMFEISFALHVTPEEMNKFLTDVLAEQTYNLRSPTEIIALFCHSREEYHSYAEYTYLLGKYEAKADSYPSDGIKRANYTMFAGETMKRSINTEDELFTFLRENQPEFSGVSQTAYDEFVGMYNEICKRVRYQHALNDDYLRDAMFATEQDRLEFEERVNRSNELKKIENSPNLADELGLEYVGKPEQFARAVFDFIPRATFVRETRSGERVITTDFIPIANGENGQRTRKTQTTRLPRDITMNFLMRDRIDDLLRKKDGVKVNRKDLVFLKYFLFSLDLNEKDVYTLADYLVFKDECDDMLLRCGMSRLYIANRFENLIMLSLLSENPFEMFANIIEYSFINEPEPTSDELNIEQ